MTGPLPGYIIYKLRDFLGSYRNSQLTSIGDAFPVGDPVLAADIIPVRIPLSGGEISFCCAVACTILTLIIRRF